MTWSKRLYKSLKHIAPWPHMWKCTPPLRHKPLPQDEDVEFWSDIRYLQDLADAIVDDTRLARREIGPDIFADFVGRPLLQAVEIPIESQKFWSEFGEWPADDAAFLLTLWRFDREVESWIDRREIDEAAA